MKFGHIVDSLKDIMRVELEALSDSNDIVDIALIDGTETFFHTSTLYFGYNEQLSEMPNLPQHCILAGKHNDFSNHFTFNNCAVISNKDLFLAYNHVKLC